MRRSPIWLAALLGLLLAACTSANTPVPAPTSNVAQVTSTPQAQPTEPATAASQPGTTTPVATPDIARIIKAQPDDWKRGPDDAKVTIIEWGDFQ